MVLSMVLKIALILEIYLAFWMDPMMVSGLESVKGPQIKTKTALMTVLWMD